MGISTLNDLKNRALHLIAEKVIVKENVDTATAEWRFSICDGCDRNNKSENKPFGVCMDCGCFLDLKQKSKINWNAKRMRNEITHCPNGFWNDKNIANLYREMDGKELLT